MAKIAMDEKVYRVYRYDVSETDIVRIIVITSLVVTCTVIAAISFSRSITLINYQLFFIPILYATYFYAKRGLLVAGICGILYQGVGYYYRFPDFPALMGVTSEAFLFIIIASLMTYFIERIRDGEARYRSVFLHSQLGIILFHLPDYRIKQTNDKFASMLHYSTGEITEMTFPSLAYTPRENQVFLERIAENRDCENFEIRFRTKEGDSCWVNLSWSAIDEQTVSVTIVNVNARKLIEEINNDTMMKYRSLTDNSPTSILVLLDGQIRFANPAFCAYSEYSPQELVGKDLLFMLDSRDKDKFGVFSNRLVSETQLPDGTEFRFVTKSGGQKVAMVFANPITHDNVQATMMNLVDISVQQRLEERIQLDNERRRGIIITVAHELRTPLQPILGYLNLLIQDPEAFGILDNTKKMLERCLVSVDRERQIINQMLELSILESGKIRLTFSEFALSPLVHSVLDTGGYFSKGDITVDIPDDLVIRADQDRMFSVLDSILSNAVNYSKPPRKIHIAYRPGTDGISHAISVQDNGIGIEKKMFASIFEPFQLADAAKLSRKYDRLGLSLSIAKQIIQMHGGDITVESTVNVGSTFTIQIPRELPKEIPHVE
ncbi:MAG: PAS domain-containing sensor histidine kinase [Methanoregula sp.]|jgi:PAS domain S-box-containing protein